MKKDIRGLILVVLTLGFVSACANMPGGQMAEPQTSAQSTDSPLVQRLTSKLGVSNTQAAGGAGAMLAYAKGKLSPDDYSKVSSALPETESLVKAAPQNDMMDGMKSMLGGDQSSAGGMASLAGSFGQLGLDSDMIGMYLPILLEYASEFGGGSIGSILGGVLQ